jgi:hypothetical protein
MVAVKMGDKDFADLRGGKFGKNHLPLRAFAGVKEKAFIVPAQKIPVVIAFAGWNLAGSAESIKSSM